MENNENTGGSNLVQKLSEETEIKKAGEVPAAQSFAAGATNVQPKTSKYWSEDDFDEEPPAPTPPPAAETKTDTPAAKTDKPAPDPQAEIEKTEKPLTRAAKEAHARITVSAIDTVQTLAFTFAVNHRFKKKFTEDEIPRLETISDAVPAALTDTKDKQLWLKWDKLMKKRDKKIRQIEMSETEKKDLSQLFMDYQEATGKLLSPGWGLMISISDILVNRAITVFMED